ncbi:uncharacterized protein LOC136030039 [Artemia franciscana]
MSLTRTENHEPENETESGNSEEQREENVFHANRDVIILSIENYSDASIVRLVEGIVNMFLSAAEDQEYQNGVENGISENLQNVSELQTDPSNINRQRPWFSENQEPENFAENGDVDVIDIYLLFLSSLVIDVVQEIINTFLSAAEDLEYENNAESRISENLQKVSELRTNPSNINRPSPWFFENQESENFAENGDVDVIDIYLLFLSSLVIDVVQEIVNTFLSAAEDLEYENNAESRISENLQKVSELRTDPSNINRPSPWFFENQESENFAENGDVDVIDIYVLFLSSLVIDVVQDIVNTFLSAAEDLEYENNAESRISENLQKVSELRTDPSNINRPSPWFFENLGFEESENFAENEDVGVIARCLLFLFLLIIDESESEDYMEENDGEEDFEDEQQLLNITLIYLT